MHLPVAIVGRNIVDSKPGHCWGVSSSEGTVAIEGRNIVDSKIKIGDLVVNLVKVAIEGRNIVDSK